MPVRYARGLTSPVRSVRANLHLGVVLAFVAGATNAGAFLAVRQYTSHMTGVVSSIADHLVIGERQAALAGVGALLSFLAGAALTAVLVNYARRRRLRSLYAFPLLIEAALLLLFGLLGARLATLHTLFVPVTVMVLCFAMGLQNAVITKVSNAEIRTTHVTGLVTDIGIELGRLLYWNRSGDVGGHGIVRANRRRLRLLTLILTAFFGGGVAGAAGFQWTGYLATIPLAAALVVIGALPVYDDLRRWVRLGRARPARRRGIEGQEGPR